jgi:hypothetical protein
MLLLSAGALEHEMIKQILALRSRPVVLNTDRRFFRHANSLCMPNWISALSKKITL